MTYQENVLKLSEEKRKTGQQYDEGAVCEICLKTKFADGVGHSCYYCHKKSCARCGRRVALKSPKPTEKANEVSCFVQSNSRNIHKVPVSVSTNSISQHRWEIFSNENCFFWIGNLYKLHYMDSSVIECWTYDQKIAGSSPSRSDGSIFFTRVNFLF